ncbi:hypothetical protein GCM10023340_08390 [Nocardioides marinquilinus]|uniref:DUF4911 domain-containing protein n=1 Tax=Nocardioides marinquilinus TaxID=1210400 RepID=A0ABP9PAB7_9ACTN
MPLPLRPPDTPRPQWDLMVAYRGDLRHCVDLLDQVKATPGLTYTLEAQTGGSDLAVLKVLCSSQASLLLPEALNALDAVHRRAIGLGIVGE